MLSTTLDQPEEPKHELEDQFVLRLPQKEAESLRKVLRTKPKKVKKLLKISFDDDMRRGTVQWNKKTLHARLFDLPCHVESYKSTDNVDFYKTADVSKILVCKESKFEENDAQEETSKKASKKHFFQHGIAPPLKNVRKRRFRKVLKNRNNFEDSDEIEKEVLWLLRMDVQAVCSRYEIFYDSAAHKERLLFGEIISDSDSDEEEAATTPEISSN